MSYYYFHVSDGLGFAEDNQGQDLPDVDAARRVAIEGARSLMAEELRAGELNLASFIWVEDHTQRLMFTLTFAEAIEIHDKG